MAIQQKADKTAVVNITKGVITGVTPETIHMGDKPKQHIEWTIASTDQNVNYTFPDDGIVIIKPDPTKQFKKLGPGGHGKKFTFHDKNSDHVLYKYTVKVMNGTTPLKPLDPGIQNEA